jgi:carboxyl-terminal processing protease
VIAGVFAAGVAVGRDAPRVSAASSDESGYTLLREILGLLRRESLTPVNDTQRLFDGAARGMLESLGDPYTRYMDAKSFKDFSQDAQGFFFGIGIFIDIREGHLIVVQPIEGTPAHRAGLRAGDRIRTIDGVTTDGMALQEAVSRIRGAAGSKVKIGIGRQTQNLDVEITRARVQVVTVQGAGTLDEPVRKQLAADGLGYIRILTFNDQTAKEVGTELDRLLAAGTKGLILDLRNNGGGLLDAALRISDRFVPDGKPIVHIVQKGGRRATERASRTPKVTIPVVVLVNEFSASASEILTGALKDTARATVVGQKTFGKGVIQSVFPVSGGGGAAITTAKYLTPSDHDIHGRGIAPDVAVGDRLEGKSEAVVLRILADQLTRGITVLKQRIADRR